MKRIIWMFVVISVTISLVACGKSYESKLVGSWYLDGSEEAQFTLYDDGTCEMSGEYGTGTWSVVNDNQLKLTTYYGETETASIVSLKDDCLTLGDGDDVTELWKYAIAEQPTSKSVVNEPKAEEPTEKTESFEETETFEEAELVETYENVLAQDIYNLCETSFWDDENSIRSEKAMLWAYGTSEDNDREYLGIIDNDLRFIPCEYEFSYSYSDFSNGYAYINYDTSGKFLIVNTEGAIVYESPNDAKYRVLCGGDGYYYVEKNISGFDVNETTYWILSVDGEMVQVDFVSEQIAAEYIYHGSGCLQLGYYIFVDMSNCNIYYTESDDGHDPEFVGFTENKELVWCINESLMNYDPSSLYLTDSANNTRKICTIDYDYSVDMLSYAYGEELIFALQRGDRDSGGHYQYTNAKYYDLQGNVAIDLSQYNVQTYNVGEEFTNGYSVHDMVGEDNQHYLAVIDKTGGFVFEPIEYHYADSPRMIGRCYNGYVIMERSSGLCVVDCANGNITELPSPFSSMHIKSYVVLGEDCIFDIEHNKYFDFAGIEYPIFIKQ